MFIYLGQSYLLIYDFNRDFSSSVFTAFNDSVINEHRIGRTWKKLVVVKFKIPFLNFWRD